ncbi:MAG: electron transfer flavoprotein subunit beta/FixA family protein [Deltaproteobacteria bacterium]|nr:electron transfer flavoprotein subunit beta/FixA family protein [Deltaproteobacteria bacterium]
MKILVTVKRVPDPEMKPKFKGASLDLSSASWVVNTFDEYAVETALRLTENGATGERFGEVVVLSIGPKDASQQLRSALAMGADRAILVDALDENLDSDSVARIVQAVVSREKPDLLLMGKQAVDGDANQAGQVVAGLLGWAQATFAAEVSLAADAKSVLVSREVDSGVESKRIPLPGVVTVDLRIVAPKAVKNGKTPDSHAYADGPRYASLKGIMAAKKKEIKELKLADLGVSVTPKVKWISVEPPPARKAGIKVGDVQELVKRLHDEAKVL